MGEWIYAALVGLFWGQSISDQPAKVQYNVEHKIYERYIQGDELWCDCEYIARCEDGRSFDHSYKKVGYRGHSIEEAKKAACNYAKSAARVECGGQLKIFAVSGHKCPALED